MERPDAWQMTDRLTHELGKGDPFAAAVRATRMPMIITDPRQDDNPIVFANDAFLTLTGYARDEIMGRNCRFLQGADTDKAAVRARPRRGPGVPGHQRRPAELPQGRDPVLERALHQSGALCGG